MNNPLTGVAPGRWRKVGYIAFAVVGVTITGLTAGFAAIESEVPKWLVFTAAFYGTITGPVWAVPASNVTEDS
jgi:hypothetical protein